MRPLIVLLLMLLPTSSLHAQGKPPECIGANKALQYDGKDYVCATISGVQGPQGPAGPQGSTGPAGPAGPAGPQGVEEIDKILGEYNEVRGGALIRALLVARARWR